MANILKKGKKVDNVELIMKTHKCVLLKHVAKLDNILKNPDLL